MELGYWSIRGRAQSIRLLLEFTGEKYTETMYTCGPAPDFDKSGWLAVKDQLNLDFPNLPYLIHGDVRLTQSHAILRYLGRRHGLLGETEEERVRVDMLQNQLLDFRNGWSRFCYSPEFEQLKPSYINTASGTIARFSRFLDKRSWFAGEKLTIVDFLMYELLDCHRTFHATLLKPYSNLASFLRRFEELAPIKAYMTSGRFMRAPLNNKTATFGSE